MPSILSSSSSNTPNPKSYAPLSDELNPPFGNIAPVPQIAKNGTIIYSKRVTSGPSDFPVNEEGDERYHDLNGRGGGGGGGGGEGSRGLRSESEETLSPSFRNGVEYLGSGDGDGEGDIGEYRRKNKGKGKGKEREWDPERGEEEEEEYDRHQHHGEIGVYPPVQSEVEEERRIQERLAMFAARDMARRRAARMSRQLPNSPPPPSSSQMQMSTTSARRPLSGISEGSSKRGSLMGLVGGIWGGTRRDPVDNPDGVLPLSSPRQQQQYINPYESYPTAPSMSPNDLSDNTTHNVQSPFIDPPSNQPHTHTRHLSSQSGTSSSLQSPTDEVGFTYSGPTYRRAPDGNINGVGLGQNGGNSIAGGTRGRGNRNGGGEKWWHALCAWGEELDGDANDGQAGRTNPFE